MQLLLFLLLQLLTTISVLFLFPYLLFRFLFKIKPRKLPKSYPIIGTYLAASANKHRRQQWFTELVQNSPTATFSIKHLNGPRQVVTANPSVVQHILRTNFPNYGKGAVFRVPITDFLGDGIFNTDGKLWKFQRQVASHEFSTRSLRRFVETAVDEELCSRLIPIFSSAADSASVLDLQDVLQRFAFDNICKIAFGYDPAYLLPSLPDSKFAEAFDDATMISGLRSASLTPVVWKLKRLFGIGSEKRLATAVAEVRGFAMFIIREKKKQLAERSRSSDDDDSFDDLLSRFLSAGHSDERFVTDIVISFILAGRDTTSSALTWFFWLLSQNPEAEQEILREISEIKHDEGSDVYDEVKEMVYTHAALCESMRLYPPVPSDSKEVLEDDILPDGTAVKKGERVTYLPYAMGRLEAIWGKDWADYRPERWLNKATEGLEKEKWVFVRRDPYTYPVFQAGPRICLGKDMAFVQMKRIATGVLRRFRVVPAMPDDAEPVFVSYLTSKMRDGFPVRVQERAANCFCNKMLYSTKPTKI